MKSSAILIILLQCSALILSAQDCLPEGIIFTRQSQIDSFQFHYPGCSQIDGDMEINGEQSDIHSLAGLAQVQVIHGELNIHDLENVTNLQGLNQIITIGWILRIENNPGLSTCAGLNHLTHLGESVIIRGNDNLESLVGFDSLHKAASLVVSGNNRLQDLTGIENLDTLDFGMLISSNTNLKSLSGLENWKIMNGDLRIYNNDSLSDISSLHNLTTLFGTFNVSGNANLLSFHGLDSLKEIYGDLEVNENGLTSFVGLDHLEKIYGSFIVDSNVVLQNFLGLPRLRSVNSINFKDNSTLTSLTGLEGLQTIVNSVGLFFNPALVDLSALINVYNLKMQIIIRGNTALTNLYGLDHLCNTFIQKVEISANDHLSDCAVASICTHLIHGGVDFIAYNATGCNTREEIVNECVAATQSPVVNPEISVYPNPTYDILDVSLTGDNPISYSIFEPAGKLLKQWSTESSTLDVSELSPGVYILNIRFANRQVNKRVIKL
jgi:hypothetical protein